MNPNNTQPTTEDIQWLLDHAMLARGEQIATQYQGKGTFWQRPYAAEQPRAASSLASAWLTVYPSSIITRPGESVLHTLGDETLWKTLAEIGIDGLHTGPMKRAGGISGRAFTPTIDGHFDRIMLEIDPDFGTLDEYLRMSANAGNSGATLIGDIVPGHTGKSADFRLAELGYADYPGIYHMAAIDEADWPLLPPVPDGRDSINLSVDIVDALHAKGYIVGQLSRVIFYEPGVKDTNWSVTDVITGVDGVARRWVYLHYFKEGQPSLDWLNPTFAAQRLVLGDALHSLGTLGVGMLRLDANGFLGVEPREDGPAWSEGHPLSITGNQLIAGLVRKAGGFTFQELNLTVDDIAAMSQGGADLSYDFITRPAYQHALVAGDTEFLRLMLRIMHEQQIEPASLIHALQNHDELTLELVHFWTLHKEKLFEYEGKKLTGAALRERIRSMMYDRLTGERAPYNQRFVTNGVASTTASVIAAALGYDDIEMLNEADVKRIKQAHLLLVMYNAFQPGVFALSGWDLVGALTLPIASLEHLTRDGDTRWINRGAYDLMGIDGDAKTAASGLPRAQALYDSLPQQMRQPDSFAAQLKRLLAVRRQYRIYAAKQIGVPAVANPGVLILIHELPDELGTQITSLNFGEETVAETVTLPAPDLTHAIDMLTNERLDCVDGMLTIPLDGHAGRSLLMK